MQNYDIEMWRYAKEIKRPSDNPVLGHEHVPSSTATLQSTSIRINDRGLRGGPVPDKGPDGKRIVFLGSSITLGWGVPEAETLTEKLNDKFAKAVPGVAVLNAGIGNYNTVRYVERFLTRLTKLEPEIIVVQYFVNDAEVLERGGGNWLLRNSQLAVTLWIAANRYFRPSGESSLVSHYKKLYERSAPGYRTMTAALQKLSDHARKKGIKVVLAMTPDVHNLTNYPFGFVHAEIKSLCSQLGFAYVDLLPAFAGYKAKELWAMPGDPHPNALGHRLMADALFPTLLAMVRPTSQ